MVNYVHQIVYEIISLSVCCLFDLQVAICNIVGASKHQILNSDGDSGNENQDYNMY